MVYYTRLQFNGKTVFAVTVLSTVNSEGASLFNSFENIIGALQLQSFQMYLKLYTMSYNFWTIFLIVIR